MFVQHFIKLTAAVRELSRSQSRRRGKQYCLRFRGQ